MSKVNRILELCEDHGFEIVSYGLAPRPNGFMFEMPDIDADEYAAMSGPNGISELDSAAIVLSNLLDSLNRDEVRELRQLVFG